MPTHVRKAAAQGVTTLPKGALDNKAAMALIRDIRASELRQSRALRDAVAHSDKVRAQLARTKQ